MRDFIQDIFEFLAVFLVAGVLAGSTCAKKVTSCGAEKAKISQKSP